MKIHNWVGHTFSLIFKLFPIKKNRIYFISRYGQSYSCNPRAYFEYLYKNHHDEFEFCYCLNKNTNVLPKDVKHTKYMSIRDLFYLHTSKYVVSNQRLCMLFGKRKNQVYIQAWHGGSPFILKKIEADKQMSFANRWNSKIDSAQLDILVAGSKAVKDIFKRCFMCSPEKILLTGTPRYDMLINKDDSLIKTTKERLGINENEFVVLYAPTFREDRTFAELLLDNQKLKTSFERLTGKSVKILYRFHPYKLTRQQKEMKFEDFVLNVTNYPEIQELILISNLLITDYSTCMCDMILANKPCILFFKDYNKYVSEERGLYFSPKVLPFPVANDEKELENIILNLDDYLMNYKQMYQKFLVDFGNVEDGHACEHLYNEMIKK